MLKKLVAALALLVSSHCFAAVDPALRESIERMFGLMNVQKLLDTSQAQLKGVLQQQIAQVAPEKQPIARRHLARMLAIIGENLRWERMREPMVTAYAQVYTKAEVDELVAFYETPVGRKMLAKTPELMAATQQTLQGLMGELTPRLQAIGQEMEAEMKQ